MLLVLAVVGQLLRLFSLAFLPPLVFALATSDWDAAGHFVLAWMCTIGFGLVLTPYTGKLPHFHRAEALGVVAFTWLGIGLFGAIPYALAGLGWTDALFESISGFTTTGATILTDFSAHSPSFFLWRSMTQWFGGLGVIALFVIVLPRLGIAGRQLVFAESSGAPGEAVSPQIRHTAARLWLIYAGLTLILAILLAIAGMTPFDAICHALTTMAAGGFSPNPESIAGFHSPTIEWILVPFMVLAGTSFPLIYTVLVRKPLAFFRDGEFFFYVAVTVGGALALALAVGGEDAIRAGFFQAASLISSTGFASTDYNLWSDGAKVTLILIMFVGGCAGSAAGGPKVVRHLLAIKHVLREIKRVLHPRAVMTVKYKGRAVSESIMRDVFTLLVLYVTGYFVVGMALTLMGYDMVTSFSAAIACLGNVGPAFNEAGPMGSFAFFSDGAKVLLTATMWIGRLEIITVIALLHMHVLRNVRLGWRERDRDWLGRR